MSFTNVIIEPMLFRVEASSYDYVNTRSARTQLIANMLNSVYFSNLSIFSFVTSMSFTNVIIEPMLIRAEDSSYDYVNTRLALAHDYVNTRLAPAQLISRLEAMPGVFMLIMSARTP